jgi:hypothetical protein
VRIGLDLDDTVFAWPEFFRELIVAMSDRGHLFFCTSGRGRAAWESEIVPQLLALGIDPDLINPSLMTPERTPHVTDKARMADQLDLVFDDDAGRIQRHTHTPVFFVPQKRTVLEFFCAVIK